MSDGVATLQIMTCAECDRPMPRHRLNSKYCGPVCQKQVGDRGYRERNPTLLTTSGTTGAISELIVAADLMARGFEVFRSLSPNASCDLVVIVHGRLWRVEVRTGSRRKDGSLTCSDGGHYDLLAIVSRDRVEIAYNPRLDALQQEECK